MPVASVNLSLNHRKKESTSHKSCPTNIFAGEGHLIIWSHKLFYLGQRVAPTQPLSGCNHWGLAKKSWPQINSAIYGPSPSNCGPRDGKYCSLSRITGCRNAPKACFMAGHKCSQREAGRVGLISAPEESRSVTYAPLGKAVMDASGRWWEAGEGREGHFAVHYASPRHLHSDTRWRTPIASRAAGGCQAVTEL